MIANTTLYNMDLKEETLKFMSLAATTSRNLSSSSSTFFSANQSPFFSPRSPVFELPEPSRPKIIKYDNPTFVFSDIPTTPAACFSKDPHRINNGHVLESKEKLKGHCRSQIASFTSSSSSLSLNRLKTCDVYVGLYGRNPPLLRFSNWLRAELEAQGLSCFISDRARCKTSRKHGIAKKAIDVCSFGIVIVTRKAFKNPYTIEELRFFSGKKNLVPLFFDVGPNDCLVRDIVEKRGELWEKYGGELWLSYGGLEKDWREAVNGLCRVDEWKLEARNGNWRDCIFATLTLLATKLGRKIAVERFTKWRETVYKDEFPFPRHENFIGRNKELSELEFILFGETKDSERDYIELKARPRRTSFPIGSSVIRNEKEPFLWRESEKEIELQGFELPPRPKSGVKHKRRKRSTKFTYGKGIACVCGESGIGKTELLLEFAYRNRQRYKMALWVGGESRYIRQNFLNLCSCLGIDVGIENCLERGRTKSFEEHEESAVSRIRKEFMRGVPFLIIIDNLESEKDWWDYKLIMDLLPRFGGETHVIISTRLPRVMNLEPLKLSYLSESEAISLMQGCDRDYPLSEIDALRVIEEKIGRLTLGLAVIGSILCELPISPSRLLDTIDRVPLINSLRENHPLRQNSFLFQVFEVCLSIIDHADGSKSLATRMFQACGWFGPGRIPVSLLALSARKIPKKRDRISRFKSFLRAKIRGCDSPHASSESDASSQLLCFNLARICTKRGYLHFHSLSRLYARERGSVESARSVVKTVISRGLISHHSEHLWAACYFLFGFRSDPMLVSLKASELLHVVKQVVLPLAIRTFFMFSRCCASLELLHVCTNTLEAADHAFVELVERWLENSFCWKPMKTSAELNPYVWQELALSRAEVLETRAKLMLRGGQIDIGDDLMKKALFIRSSICGEKHPDTISVRETLSKLTQNPETV